MTGPDAAAVHSRGVGCVPVRSLAGGVVCVCVEARALVPSQSRHTVWMFDHRRLGRPPQRGDHVAGRASTRHRISRVRSGSRRASRSIYGRHAGAPAPAARQRQRRRGGSGARITADGQGHHAAAPSACPKNRKALNNAKPGVGAGGLTSSASVAGPTRLGPIDRRRGRQGGGTPGARSGGEVGEMGSSSTGF